MISALRSTPIWHCLPGELDEHGMEVVRVLADEARWYE
jgi:hypothetical protein